MMSITTIVIIITHILMIRRCGRRRRHRRRRRRGGGGGGGSGGGGGGRSSYHCHGLSGNDDHRSSRHRSRTGKLPGIMKYWLRGQDGLCFDFCTCALFLDAGLLVGSCDGCKTGTFFTLRWDLRVNG